MSSKTYVGKYRGVIIKPCPFCGSDGVLKVYDGDWATVYCSGQSECLVHPQTHPHCPSPESAVYDWNLRGRVIARREVRRFGIVYVARFTYNGLTGTLCLVDRHGLNVPCGSAMSEDGAIAMVDEIMADNEDDVYEMLAYGKVSC